MKMNKHTKQASVHALGQVHPAVDPITSLTSLPVPVRDASDSDAPKTSEEGFARQFFRVWTRRLMLFCGVCAVCLSAAVPALSTMKVEEITLDGHAHYEAETLLAGTGLSVGDELLAWSPREIEQSLLATYPYLETARVTRGVSGRVHVHVTERTPQWALYVSEESLAWVDASMQVLELAPTRGELCLVKCELFCADQNGQAADESISPGTAYRGNVWAIEKLSDIHEALLSLGYDTPPDSIDMSDRYAVTLYLADGTTVALHECRAPAEQVRAALGGLQAYRQQYGESGPMLVEVDDFSRVSLRPLPQNGQ